MIHDISPALTSDMAVFPGDTPLSRDVLLDMNDGDNLTLSTLRSTVHIGAHVDGPNHYGKDAPGVDALPIDLFIGPCQVMHVSVKPGARITTDHLTKSIETERVLLRTNTWPDRNEWREDFAAPDEALVDFLHEQGVRLVGVDTPSVDFATEKVLRVHHRFLANNMTILEGIDLRDVPAGMYELIALPLPLVGFDASPVRAVLRTLNETGETTARPPRTD